jgi:hypothetical protein
MARLRFRTVPTELVEYAESIAAYFQNRGYRIYPEYYELGYPARPTLCCKRKGTTLIVEVNAKVPEAALDDWVRFAASASNDTEVALCLPDHASVKPSSMTFLQSRKIGLYVASVDICVERLAPADLALKIALPEISQLPRKVRELLGPVYEQFERTQWREGFKEACQILEEEARRHLKKGVRNSRIVVLDKSGNAKPLTDAQIDRMTLGALATAFTTIKTPNSADDLIAKSLKSINPDRVASTHHKAKKSTERSLRRNVGKHIWTIIAALKELHA